MMLHHVLFSFKNSTTFFFCSIVITQIVIYKSYIISFNPNILNASISVAHYPKMIILICIHQLLIEIFKTEYYFNIFYGRRITAILRDVSRTQLTNAHAFMRT